MTPQDGAPFDPRPLFRSLSIPEGLARSREISPGAKLLYGALVKRAGTNGYCWPSKRILADDLGLSERQIQRYIGELEQHELIARRVRYSQGHQRSNAYHFLWSSALLTPASEAHRGETDVTPLGETDLTPLGETDVSPRKDKSEVTKRKRDTRASAPPAVRCARDLNRDLSGATLAAAAIVAEAQGLAMPDSTRERRAWLRGTEPLAEHPAKTIRAAVRLKLEAEPTRWKAKPLLPRYVAEDLPALLRELAVQPQGAAALADRPDELYDRAEVMRLCRLAGLDEKARAAWKARDWPAVLALYRSAKAETMGAAA